MHRTKSLLPVLFLFSLMSLGCSQPDTQYTLSPTATPTTLTAIGAELDAHFHAQHVPRSAGASADDWERIVVPRIASMGLQSLRVMVLPTWYEPVNDNDDPDLLAPDAFTFDSEEMQGVYRVLDTAEQLGIAVTIVPWGAYRDTFLAPGTSGWVVAPTDLPEYAENLTALMHHLVDVKGYGCIAELTPMNEPDGHRMEPADYVVLCCLLRDRLQREGLLGRFRLDLIDSTDQGGSYGYLQTASEGLKDIADVINSHTYIFGYDTPTSRIVEWERENSRLAAAIGVRHRVGEFGSNLCVGASRQQDIDWYSRGVLIVRNALALLAGGASGVSYWQLFDQYYARTDSYAQMQQLGMWRSVRDDYASEEYYADLVADYQPRPQYYAYSLLTRFIRPGADIYALDVDTATVARYPLNCALAAHNVDGTWVYVLANMDEEATLDVAFHNPLAPTSSRYERYLYADDHLPTDDSQLPPDARHLRTTALSGALRTTVPPNSVVLLRTATH